MEIEITITHDYIDRLFADARKQSARSSVKLIGIISQNDCDLNSKLWDRLETVFTTEVRGFIKFDLNMLSLLKRGQQNEMKIGIVIRPNLDMIKGQSATDVQRFAEILRKNIDSTDKSEYAESINVLIDRALTQEMVAYNASENESETTSLLLENRPVHSMCTV